MVDENPAWQRAARAVEDGNGRNVRKRNNQRLIKSVIEPEGDGMGELFYRIYPEFRRETRFSLEVSLFWRSALSRPARSNSVLVFYKVVLGKVR